MVVDGLLLKLNAMGYTAQAYADDLTIVIQGKYFSTVVDLMQGSFRVVDNWCKTKGLSINPEKTEVVLFTRKRKTEGIERLEQQVVKLNLSKEVKYLDTILDDKLMWKAYMRRQMKNGPKALWSCNTYFIDCPTCAPRQILACWGTITSTWRRCLHSEAVPWERGNAEAIPVCVCVLSVYFVSIL